MAIDSVNSFGGNAGYDQVWREAPASPVAEYDGPARSARFPHREIQLGHRHRNRRHETARMIDCRRFSHALSNPQLCRIRLVSRSTLNVRPAFRAARRSVRAGRSSKQAPRQVEGLG